MRIVSIGWKGKTKLMVFYINNENEAATGNETNGFKKMHLQRNKNVRNKFTRKMVKSEKKFKNTTIFCFFCFAYGRIAAIHFTHDAFYLIVCMNLVELNCWFEWNFFGFIPISYAKMPQQKYTFNIYFSSFQFHPIVSKAKQ